METKGSIIWNQSKWATSTNVHAPWGTWGWGRTKLSSYKDQKFTRNYPGCTNEMEKRVLVCRLKQNHLTNDNASREVLRVGRRKYTHQMVDSWPQNDHLFMILATHCCWWGKIAKLFSLCIPPLLPVQRTFWESDSLQLAFS